MADIDASWNPAAARKWAVAEATRIVYGSIMNSEGLLKFKTSCHVLANKGITFADLARKAS